MPSSLLPGRGWRASWRADRGTVGSSAARAGTHFAAAWFSLCRCEDASPSPRKKGGPLNRERERPSRKGPLNPKEGEPPVRLLGTLEPSQDRPIWLGCLDIQVSGRAEQSEYGERKDQRLHQAQSSNLDELRSLHVPITGFRAAERRLGGRGHAARACQGHGNNKNQRSHPISPEGGSIGRNF